MKVFALFLLIPLFAGCNSYLDGYTLGLAYSEGDGDTNRTFSQEFIGSSSGSYDSEVWTGYGELHFKFRDADAVKAESLKRRLTSKPVPGAEEWINEEDR